MKLRRHFFKGWIPIRRIAVLANLYGGAGRFCTLVSGRTWMVLLVRRDRSMPAVPEAERLTFAEALEQADGPRI
ncbi:hypothetical protein I0C86_40530 [Plantactinospora sp. S1510]|uniref:Uncharacterized protein n=1 Tax=Plantactinospora alkalitolerans TaxID=2789879 RepID=A0ABS0H9K5_9ACTN|nr:hypothetical protein [Plantactinospora alkalitolerans]MBF9135168.1 hypothetical protein [Plantactinospora alkalitolerans]